MRAQLFVQDAGVSLFIAVVAVLSLIAFINFHINDLTERVRYEHEIVIAERLASKLFLEENYAFNNGAYSINNDVLDFVEKLNTDDYYERFRDEMAMSREGVSYNVHIGIECDDGSGARGGKKSSEMAYKKIIAYKDGSVCTVSIGVGER